MNNKLCFIDTNIFIYAFLETQDEWKTEVSKKLIEENDIVLSIQVINEICVNLLKSKLFSEQEIREIVRSLYKKYTILPINEWNIIKASELREKYNLSYWDSLMIAAAYYSDTEIFYSEDMHHNLIIENKLEIKNPFKK